MKTREQIEKYKVMEIKSYKEQIDYIFYMQSIIINESNSCRNWQTECIEVFTDAKFNLDPNKYYLHDFYKDNLGKLYGKLFEIEDFFGGWIDTFLNGRTSIFNMINVYTVENLELQIDKYTNCVNEAWESRCKWIEANKIN